MMSHGTNRVGTFDQPMGSGTGLPVIRFQFSMAALLGAIAYAAAWCVALTTPHTLIARAVESACCVGFMIATSAAILSRGKRRVFWLGFLGWGFITYVADTDAYALYDLIPNQGSGLLALAAGFIGGIVTTYFWRPENSEKL
jgi:hypothetical protein